MARVREGGGRGGGVSHQLITGEHVHDGVGAWMLILLSLDGVAHGQRRSGDRRGCGDEVRAAAERGSSVASGHPPCHVLRTLG